MALALTAASWACQALSAVLLADAMFLAAVLAPRSAAFLRLSATSRPVAAAQRPNGRSRCTTPSGCSRKCLQGINQYMCSTC
ncbi:unnamed protein product [Urochloa humidicola]